MKQLQRMQDEELGWRWYYEEGKPRSEWYISVTTALQVLIPQKLQEYMRRTDGEKQKETLTRRSEEGTSFHDLVEADLRGVGFTVADGQRRAFDAWLEIKNEHNITSDGTELAVASDKYGYAGTFDAVGTVDGERALIDIKTGWVSEKAGWQLGAYRNAIFEETGEKLGMYVIQLRSDGRSKLIKYTHYDFCFSRFLDGLGAFRGFNYWKLNDLGWRWLHVERPLLP